MLTTLTLTLTLAHHLLLLPSDLATLRITRVGKSIYGEKFEDENFTLKHTVLSKGKAAQASASWLCLRRLLSAPEHGPGCPKLRPASADPPLGPRWPGIQALFSK